jgi:hypothetical protein
MEVQVQLVGAGPMAGPDDSSNRGLGSGGGWTMA